MKTARELGLIPQGRLEPGPGNEITDVAGVSIGHRSLRGEGVYTGITAIVPHPGDIFRVKPRAAVEVINGFGKSAGLMQVAELGTLETPILLTNTFSVSACTEALIRRAVAANPAIGRQTSTVNAVVCECNDGSINDIQALAVTPADAEAALDAARMGPVEQGAVGAGSGMTAFGFKAGIGTASRRMRIGKRDFTLGTLVLANFGAAGDLVLPDGAPTRSESAGQARMWLRYRRHGDGPSFGRSPVAADHAAGRRGSCPPRRLLGPWQRRCRPLFHHCRSGGARAARILRHAGADR